MIATGCYWGSDAHKHLWAKCLEKINISREIRAWLDIWLELSFYPSLLLLYTGGVSSLIANRYDNFASLLTLPKYVEQTKEFPLILYLATNQVIRKSEAEIIFNMKNHFTPTSEHLEKVIRVPHYENISQMMNNL